MVSAGLISLGGYVPAKEVPKKQQNPLVDFLRSETLLHADYIAEINDSGHLPGKIETNYDGWESQPWFQGWVKKLVLAHFW